MTTPDDELDADLPIRAPWWLNLLLGLLLAVLGAALALNAQGSGRFVMVLVALGLVAAGCLRAAAARHASFPTLDRMLATLLVALGLVPLVWRDPAVRSLPVLIAGALLASGVVNLVDASRGSRDRRIASLLSGLAALVLGALVPAWPRLTLLVVGALFGAWLVFLGLGQALWAMLLWRRGLATPADAARRPPAASAAIAFAVTLLLLGGTVFLRAGDPQRVLDAFYTPPLHVPARPGELIRSETLSSGVPFGARGWRILYTTTRGDGTPASR